jgi:hypothetical protein
MEERTMVVKIFRIVSYVLMVTGVLFILGAVGAPEDPKHAPSLEHVLMLAMVGFLCGSLGWRMYVATAPRRIFLGR